VPDGGPRIKGFDYKGQRQYSLTICVHGGAVFVDAAIVDLVIAQIQRSAETCGFALLAYCFMPDHVHLLVEGVAEDADLQKFMKSWKQKTGFEYARAHNGHRLWQVGFVDHVIRSDESMERHARYILANPIRAGLARTIDQYPFAGPRGRWPDRRDPEA
jgi:putative transposase